MFAEIRGGERESIVCVCVFGFVVAFFTYPHERKVSDKRRASSVEPTFLLDSVRIGFSLLQRPPPSPLSFFFFLPTFISWETARFSPPLLVFVFFFSLLLGCWNKVGEKKRGLRWMDAIDSLRNRIKSGESQAGF